MAVKKFVVDGPYVDITGDGTGSGLFVAVEVSGDGVELVGPMRESKSREEDGAAIDRCIDDIWNRLDNQDK